MESFYITTNYAISEEVIKGVGKVNAEPLDPMGLSYGNRMLLAPAAPLTLLNNILHEQGHVLGRYFHGEELLSTHDAVNGRFAYMFSNATLSSLVNFLSIKDYVDIHYDGGFVLEVANLIGRTLTRRQPLPYMDIISASSTEILDAVELDPARDEHLHVNESGELLIKPNLYAVAVELPAIYGQIAGLAVEHHELRSWYPGIVTQVPGYASAAYQVVQNIVHWASLEQGRGLPTTLDMLYRQDIVELLQKSGHSNKLVNQFAS